MMNQEWINRMNPVWLAAGREAAATGQWAVHCQARVSGYPMVRKWADLGNCSQGWESVSVSGHWPSSDAVLVALGWHIEMESL